MDFDSSAAVVVDFPLEGEWSAINTPAYRVPSHGTDYFAQRYAYDFARPDASGTRFQPGSLLRQVTVGVPAQHFYCWDQPVKAAFSGTVATFGDGWPDRDRVASLWEHLRVSLFAQPPRGRDYRPLAGNFVVLEGNDAVGFYAHLRSGSVCVQEGQRVATSQRLGTVGNSGNSTMPHLHFHLMDGADPWHAKAVPCVFRRYERFLDGGWVVVENGAPNRLERIRAI